MDNVRYRRFSDVVVSTSFFIMFIIIVVMGTIYVPITPIKAEQNVSQACGISGILLRADGSVIVDGWKDYSASRIASPSNPVIESKDMPTAIHLGKNLIGKTPVCFEDSMGSHCVIIEVLRKVK